MKNNKIDMNTLKSLPENDIYRLSQNEINDILNNKSNFIDINKKLMYDDRYTIDLYEQLLLMIENKLIDENFVIDFFEKISDKYKRKIINQIFHIGIDSKYKKIRNHFIEYIEKNNQNFDSNYLLVVKFQLGRDIQ